MSAPAGFKSNSSYHFKRKLGSGGSADALLFSRQTDGMPAQDVVIKTLHAGAATPEELINEGRKLASLRHPHILSTFGYEKLEKDKYGLVLEYVPGSTLQHVNPYLKQGLRASLAASIVRTVAEALSAAHEKEVIHGDISSRNVLVSDHGHLKLADFGLSMRVSDLEKSTNSGRGSVDYLAPERWAGSAPSVAADIFALGVLAHELLTGVNALQSQSLEGAKRNLQVFLGEKPWQIFNAWTDFFTGALAERAEMRGDLKNLIRKIPPAAVESADSQSELALAATKATGLRSAKSFNRTVTSLIAAQTRRYLESQPLRWILFPLFIATSFIFLIVAPGATGTDHDLPGHLRQSTLTITSQPWGEVIIDGTSRGYTPLVNLAISSGFHQFRWIGQDQTQFHRTLQTYDNGSIAYQIIKVRGEPLKFAPIRPHLTRPR